MRHRRALAATTAIVLAAATAFAQTQAAITAAFSAAAVFSRSMM